MIYVVVPLMAAVAAALAWSWWSGRARRNPLSSIDSFHRALDAMQPPVVEPAPSVDAGSARN